MRKRLLSIFILCLVATAALASPQKPQELTTLIKSPAPYGHASLNFLFMHVYDTSLWTDAREWSYLEPFALSITYRMTFTPKQLVDKSVEEMRRIHGISDKDATAARESLTEIFPTVEPGDRITAFYQPNQKIAFFYNGKPRGALTRKKLLVPFMDIWLSPETEKPEVRAKLLGIKEQET